jgi:hypothetical protein
MCVFGRAVSLFGGRRGKETECVWKIEAVGEACCYGLAHPVAL